MALYVGRFGSPDKSASGQRVYNVGVMLRACGWDVRYITAAYGCASGFFDGFPFQSVASEGHVSKPRAILDLIFEKELVRAATEACKRYSPSTVILYNGSGLLQQRLIRVCKKLGIAVFGDVTEWYSASPHMGLADQIRVRSVDWRIRHSDVHLAGVISISPYLHEYYQKLGVCSFELPPVFGEDAFAERGEKHEGPLRIIYAGSPAQKDHLDIVLKAYCMQVTKGNAIKFDLVGLSEEEMKKIFSDAIGSDALPTGLKAWGKQSRSAVLRMLAKSDVCFLIREPKRYARAGFSTKFAECMCSGVLMACNRVGGADLLLEDGVNGFVIDEATPESIASVIDRTSRMRPEELNKMSRMAVDFAHHTFARDAYAYSLSAFLKAC